MSVDVKKMELTDNDIEKINKIQKSLDNLKNKHNKFLFVMPDVKTPNASMYEIYFHATIVKKMGYHVLILTDNVEYEIPKWVDKELTEFEHIPMSDNKLSVSPEDIMVIPEIYSNVMEQTKDLPCLRIGLLQSVDYMMNALIPGMDWSRFNVRDIITTSKEVRNLMNTYFVNKFNIKIYNPGIPDYFKSNDKPKKPIISIIGRNPNEISKVVKLFYAKYPQYSWVTFDPMLTKSKPPQPMRRKDFAERLKENFAAVWVDRISSFGTFPLECMKSGVIPISLKPDITPEYLYIRDEKTDEPTGYKENSGVWTEDFYDIPNLIGEVLIKYLDDTIGDDLYQGMSEISNEYSQENAEKNLIDIYTSYIVDRERMFENALPKINEKEEEKVIENK